MKRKGPTRAGRRERCGFSEPQLVLVAERDTGGKGLGRGAVGAARGPRGEGGGGADEHAHARLRTKTGEPARKAPGGVLARGEFDRQVQRDDGGLARERRGMGVHDERLPDVARTQAGDQLKVGERLGRARGNFAKDRARGVSYTRRGTNFRRAGGRRRGKGRGGRCRGGDEVARTNGGGHDVQRGSAQVVARKKLAPPLTRSA